MNRMTTLALCMIAVMASVVSAETKNPKMVLVTDFTDQKVKLVGFLDAANIRHVGPHVVRVWEVVFDAGVFRKLITPKLAIADLTGELDEKSDSIAVETALAMRPTMRSLYEIRCDSDELRLLQVVTDARVDTNGSEWVAIAPATTGPQMESLACKIGTERASGE